MRWLCLRLHVPNAAQWLAQFLNLLLSLRLPAAMHHTSWSGYALCLNCQQSRALLGHSQSVQQRSQMCCRGWYDHVLADGYDQKGRLRCYQFMQTKGHALCLNTSSNNAGCDWSVPCSSACLYPCTCHTHNLAWGPCVVPEMVKLLQSKLLLHRTEVQSLHMLVRISMYTYRANELLGLLGELRFFVITHNLSRHRKSLSVSGLQMPTSFFHMCLRLHI